MGERGYVVEPPDVVSALEPPRLTILFVLFPKIKILVPKKQDFGRKNLLLQVILQQCLIPKVHSYVKGNKKHRD